MSENVLLGRDRAIIALPRHEWQKHLDHAPEHNKKRLAFMTEAHHQVRYFVVRELPRIGRPISPGHISRSLKLPLERVIDILDELERNLLFLVRDEDDAVAWAFPITVDQTPHAVAFSSGERLYAA